MQKIPFAVHSTTWQRFGILKNTIFSFLRSHYRIPQTGSSRIKTGRVVWFTQGFNRCVVKPPLKSTDLVVLFIGAPEMLNQSNRTLLLIVNNTPTAMRYFKHETVWICYKPVRVFISMTCLIEFSFLLQFFIKRLTSLFNLTFLRDFVEPWTLKVNSADRNHYQIHVRQLHLENH